MEKYAKKLQNTPNRKQEHEEPKTNQDNDRTRSEGKHTH